MYFEVHTLKYCKESKFIICVIMINILSEDKRNYMFSVFPFFFFWSCHVAYRILVP